MKKRVLAALLSGILVFSQTSPVMAMETAAQTAETEEAQEVDGGEGAETADAATEEIQETEDSIAGEAAGDTEEDADAAEETDGELPDEEAAVEEGEEEAPDIPDADAADAENAAAEEPEEEIPSPDTPAASKERMNGDEPLISLPSPWFRLFDDGRLELPIDTERMGDPVHFFEVTIGIWDEEEERPAFTDLVAEGDGYEVQGDTLFLDGSRIVSAFEDAGYDEAHLWIEAYVEGQEESVAIADAHLELCHSEYDPIYQDRSMLTGWDQWIDRYTGYRLRNQDHPDWGYEEVEILGFDLDDEGQQILQVEEKSDKWRLVAEENGTAEVTLTYIDFDGETKEQSFKLFIGGDVFDVYMNSEDMRHDGLPGDEFVLFTDAGHEYFDENGDYQNDRDGLSYTWDFVFGESYATVTAMEGDPSRAILKFRDLTGDETKLEGEIRVRVTVSYQGEDVAEDSTGFHLRMGYDIIEPTDLDRGLDVGNSVVETFFVRRYGYGEDGQTLSGVTFEWEDLDDNALRVTETVGGEERVLRGGDRAQGNTFKITRLSDWDTDFRLRAFWEEDGEERDIECDYRFNGKNYEISFDEHDREVFRGTDSAQLRLSVGNLGENWEDRFRIHITLGSWTDEGRTGDDWDDEEGWINKLDERDLDDSANPYYRYEEDGDDLVFTFTGELLNALDDIRVRADVYVKGEDAGFRVSDTDAWLHMRDEEYEDYRWDENLFPGETRRLKADCGDTIRVKNARYPEEADLRVVVTDVRIDSNEDAYDSRDAVIETREGDEWVFEAVRSGYADVTLFLDLYDGDEKVETREQTFRYWVGDFRAWIDLQPEGGSWDLLPGTEMNLYTRCGAERQNPDGHHEEVDVSGKKIRYEARVEWIDDEFFRQNDVRWEEVREMGRYWRACVNGSDLTPGTWYQDGNPDQETVYVYETNNHSDNLTISSAPDAPVMNIHVRAILIDTDENNPNEEWQIADTHRWIDVTYDTYELRIDGDWNPDIPVGGIAELMPTVVKYKDGVEVPISEEELAAIRYRFEWEERDGEVDSDNPPDVVITDDNGKTLTHGEDGSDVGMAPFFVQRIADWSTGFDIVAFTENDGEEHEIGRRTFMYNRFDPEAGFSADPKRGDGEGYTFVYTNEAITVTPSVEKLQALKDEGYPITWSVRYGEWQWSDETERDELGPIWKYAVDGDGCRIDDSKVEFTLTEEEFNSETGELHLDGEERMEELFEVLRYQYDEWGRRGSRFDIYLEAELNGVILCREGMRVLISRAYKRLEDDDMTTLTKKRFFYPGSKAALYVEDAAHCSGNEVDGEPGSYFEVTITGIESSDPNILRPYEEDGNWYIEAVRPGEAEITYTYTGGPEGDSGTHTTCLHVSDDYYRVEVPQRYEMLLGETGTITPKLVHSWYDAYAEGEKYQEEEVEPSSYEVYYDGWDGSRIDLDESSGRFSAKTTGESDLFAGIRYHEFDDGQWVHIRCDTSRGVFAIDESAKLYIVPGEVIRIDDEKIRSLLPPTMRIESIKNPDGVQEEIAAYYFDGGDRRLQFTSSADGGPIDTMTVPGSLAEEIEDGSTLPVSIGILARTGNEREHWAVSELAVVIHKHAEDAGTVTVQPTCAAAGVRAYHCTVCGEKLREEEVAKTGHGKEETAVTKATLSADGKIVTKCSVCGEILKTTAISRPSAFKLAEQSSKYDGKAKTPAVTVTDAAGKAIAASNYAVSYADNVNAGTAKVKISFKGNYSGEKNLTFVIAKAANPMKVKAKKPKVKYSKLLQKKQTIKAKSAVSVREAKGKVTYKKTKGDKNIKVAKNGKITIKKGLAKKKYTIKVKVMASGDKNYKSASKEVRIVITVR
ncbi:MAG: hypothetical protein IJJ52_04610 [Lachnospiraceae bacterium]|nr:hypothetical protein [Lachnospiraceae bacterium]